MNERIVEIASRAGYDPEVFALCRIGMEKFAELIVEECRNVVTDVYHKTPLELCGPLLTADEEIANHFYGVEE